MIFIIYYHMDVKWSAGLEWTCITNPEYLVVQCWVCTTFYFFLLSNTMNQTEPMYTIIWIVQGNSG